MDKKEAIELIKSEVNDKGKDPDYDADFSKLEAAGFKVTEEEREGGENEGSHYHVVLKLSKGDEATYVMCEGYYASFVGTDWTEGDVYEVQKKKVEVEQWVKT